MLLYFFPSLKPPCNFLSIESAKAGSQDYLSIRSQPHLSLRSRNLLLTREKVQALLVESKNWRGKNLSLLLCLCLCLSFYICTHT